MIDVSKLSDKYKVRKLCQKDSSSILELQQSNPLYFKYCPPDPTIQSVLQDMIALPPEKIWMTYIMLVSLKKNI